MKPGGHLATGAALAAVGYAATDSVELAVGCFAGAFLIDVDHYLDYLTVEGQWRRPGPLAFLRYAFAQRSRRLVLPLHAIELMLLLAWLAVVWPRPALLGYVVGALLHLSLDMLVNGEYALLRPLLFYSLVYRAGLGFAPEQLLAPLVLPADAGEHPIREFFTWRPKTRRLDRAPKPADTAVGGLRG